MKIRPLLFVTGMVSLWLNNSYAGSTFQKMPVLADGNYAHQSAPAKKNHPARLNFKDAVEVLFNKYQMNVVSNQPEVNSLQIDAALLNTPKDQIETAIRNFLSKSNYEFKKVSANQFMISKKETVKPAQEKEKRFYKVSGTVKDELSKPIPGVSVHVAGTSKTTVTNENGKYSIDVEPTDNLEFSFIGYKKQSVPVRNKVDINITLEPEDGSLQEIAIVAYGKQKKTSLVGAQVTIKPEELKLPVRDLSSAIAGRMAGVVAYTRSGAPGADATSIFIRGIGTFASSPQAPLLVVDGVPDRSINNIDPEDVESFTILKDAASTAIYGTRGANGVIIINTKKGKAGKPQINAELNQAINKFTDLPKFIDGPNFMQLYNEGLTMRGRTPLYTQTQIDKTASGVDPDLYPNVNWYDVLFNKYGQNKRATLNVNGGSESSTYYISVGYFGETGLFKTDNVQSYDAKLSYDRFNFTSNVDVNVTKTTKLALGINGYVGTRNQPNYGTDEIFALATASAPHVIPARYSNGQWPQLAGTLFSPYMALTQSGITNNSTSTIRSNIKAAQDLSMIVKGLNFSTMFAFDLNNYINYTRARVLQTYWATGRDANGNLITQITTPGTNDLAFGTSRYGDKRFYTESSLNYSNKFGDHDIGGLLLFNQSNYTDATSNVENYGYKAAIPYRQRNFNGRVSYGYKDRYFAEVSASYSGSDAFIPSRRYGFFPAIGAGWIVSNEKWFEPLKDVVSYFKLRYSYGASGNAAVNNANFRFLYLTTLGSSGSYSFGEPGSIQSGTGYNESRIGGDVKWESSYRNNLGIELNFLKNDLQLIVELFKERREGILLPNYVIPYNSGFTIGNIPYNNIGKTNNKGIDLTLNYTKNFRDESFFSFRGTFNYNKNLALYDGQPPWRYDYLNRIGQPISQRFGYIAMGLFKSQDEIDNAAVQSGDVRVGDIRYKDLNGDGIINSNDQTAIGYGATPRIIYGLNFGGGFKGFDIALFFQGAALVDFNYASGFGTTPFSQGSSYGNMYTQILDRWTPDNPNPRPFYPRLSTNQDATTNYYTSTWWIQRADYLRLKSAELGYTLKGEWMKKAAIKKIRIFTNGTNLLTFSKWKFWDPELGDGRGATYPNITTYNLGLRVNFQ